MSICNTCNKEFTPLKADIFKQLLQDNCWPCAEEMLITDLTCMIGDSVTINGKSEVKQLEQDLKDLDKLYIKQE